jgi:hypothetical protein
MSISSSSTSSSTFCSSRSLVVVVVVNLLLTVLGLRLQHRRNVRMWEATACVVKAEPEG